MDLKTKIEDIEKQIDLVNKRIDKLDDEKYTLSEKLEALKKEQRKKEYKKYIGKAFVEPEKSETITDIFRVTCKFTNNERYIYIKNDDCYECIYENNGNPILRLNKGHYLFSEDEEEITFDEYMKKRQDAIDILLKA